MGVTINQFIDRVVAIHVLFREERDHLTAYWKPDSPPMTVLMAGFARVFCHRNPEFTCDERRSVFHEVEHTLMDGDEQAKDAVATGFLESLQSHAANGSCDFRAIAPLLGPLARGYYRAWDDFCGAVTPGL